MCEEEKRMGAESSRRIFSASFSRFIRQELFRAFRCRMFTWLRYRFLLNCLKLFTSWENQELSGNLASLEKSGRYIRKFLQNCVSIRVIDFFFLGETADAPVYELAKRFSRKHSSLKPQEPMHPHLPLMFAHHVLRHFSIPCSYELYWTEKAKAH